MKNTNIILLGIAIILFSISIGMGMDNIIVLFVSIIGLIIALVGYYKKQ